MGVGMKGPSPCSWAVRFWVQHSLVELRIQSPRVSDVSVLCPGESQAGGPCRAEGTVQAKECMELDWGPVTSRVAVGKQLLPWLSLSFLSCEMGTLVPPYRVGRHTHYGTLGALYRICAPTWFPSLLPCCLVSLCMLAVGICPPPGS